ncbi:MAG TPA: MBL fold metallo-hydrolase [Polyangiaceae bacterium]|jgi:phosphoribosyl 1,2-cyclic phosphodiesterase|nr:MBL fold metallo-hydrolase [Polyangiaceae bacterium]
MNHFQIRFWGVRGSIAAPGPATAGVGGNTSCVEVRCGEQLFVLDAGTGLRGLGDELMRRGERRAELLLSHLHWDHIQGLPFFVPLYVPGTELVLHGPDWGEAGLGGALRRQMSAPGFPVEFADVGARVELSELRQGSRVLRGDVSITAARLNHPGGVLGYRIEYGGRTLVYATDTEHHDHVDATLRDLAQGADVLIYDAQYTPEEYPTKVGWGHSTFDAGVALARAAGVKRLALFHHDPRRADDAVFAIEERARRSFADTLAAREGMVIDLSGGGVAQAA